jgi:hypothetical protein
VPPQHLVPGIAVTFAGDLVDIEETPVSVVEEDGITGKVENGTEPFPLLLGGAAAAAGAFICCSVQWDPLY